MAVKAGYKQTEVGVIPEDWEVKPLKKISPAQSVGLVINPSTYYDERGSVPILVGSNVSENSIDWMSAKRISSESNKKIPASRLSAGDLVMVRVGEPGVVAVVPPEIDGCNCASMMIVRKHHSFDSLWLCHVMNSKAGRQQVENVQYGTAQKQFNISDAINFLYAVPTIKEQTAIATALSDADALIEALEQLIHKKRNIKQGAMQELLTGKKRLPGFSGEWEVKRLGDVCEIKKGQLITEKTIVLGSIPVIAGGKKPAYYHNKPNRVGKTITISASGASAGYVSFFDEPIFASDCSTISDGEGYVIEFLFYFLKLNQEAIYRAQTGGAQPHIHAVDLMPIEIGLPSVSEQTAIATILSDMDAEIAALEEKLNKARHIKQGMMQELLTGRVRLV